MAKRMAIFMARMVRVPLQALIAVLRQRCRLLRRPVRNSASLSGWALSRPSAFGQAEGQRRRSALDPPDRPVPLGASLIHMG